MGMRQLVHRLPASLRYHVTKVLLAQENAFRAWIGLWDALARGIVRTPYRLRRRFRARAAERVAMEAAPVTLGTDRPAANRAMPLSAGDTLLVLGAPWSHPGYAALIRRQRPGFRFALLVHDIVPLRRPEWCDQGTVRLFRAFFDDILPLCDQLFAVSQATAADVTAYARSRNMPVARPVIPVPMGTGLAWPRLR